MGKKKVARKSAVGKILGAEIGKSSIEKQDTKIPLRPLVDTEIAELAKDFVYFSPKHTMSSLVTIALKEYLEKIEKKSGKIEPRPGGHNLKPGRPMSFD